MEAPSSVPSGGRRVKRKRNTKKRKKKKKKKTRRRKRKKRSKTYNKRGGGNFFVRDSQDNQALKEEQADSQKEVGAVPGPVEASKEEDDNYDDMIELDLDRRGEVMGPRDGKKKRKRKKKTRRKRRHR